MYKYFFAVCILVPLEMYGYSLTQTDINKIKKTYTVSAFSSICSKVCQHMFKKSEEVNACAKGCLNNIVDSSINRLKSNAEKLKTGSVNRCTTEFKTSFSGETIDPKKFNKLVQKCADRAVSQFMTGTINDFPAIIQQGIQAQGGSQKVEQLILKQMQKTTKSSQDTL